ncbi:bifunctional farnesyl-diphosphate farnesyltransferase/squalene synthase [Tulasnella sp. 419]|nr:bifunctional farnesyl-diphosphate farnesyltransferase/squalene synthase [Tulasnella sp. 418]KAG8969551.1 bifunctional farnesyl-diphosphate farnesyltransferase/squalene synthase [Tulasnella sp. 419]
MGFSEYLLLALVHPTEFRSLLQYKLFHDPKRDISAVQEHPTSGWDRRTMRRCWHYLDQTSRSFAAVIKELDGDLARTICLFYLVLRGLDTIEDDMTIPDNEKQPLLRGFHTFLTKPGWTFDGNGPNEKDRDLLVEFDIVITELEHLDSESSRIIIDIARKMGTGMADFTYKAANASSSSSMYVETIEEFDLYCHYVAGLVGEGLSGLFSASGKEAEWLADQLVLSNSMGLLLQKTNILRDLAEDVEEGRHFWPKEIWGKYGFTELKELTDRKNEENALWALSGMTVNALGHLIDSLDYLTLLKNQSVFNFCAIPAVMAVATLSVCFMNPDVFHKNVKIRRGQAVQLIMGSTNPRDVAYFIRDYIRAIHAKSTPADPNHLRLGVICSQVEQWCEHHYPSFIKVGDGGRAQVEQAPNEARLRILIREDQLRNGKQLKAQLARQAQYGLQQPKEEGLPWIFFVFVLAMFLLVMGLGAIVVYGIIWWSEESNP